MTFWIFRKIHFLNRHLTHLSGFAFAATRLLLTWMWVHWVLHEEHWRTYYFTTAVCSGVFVLHHGSLRADSTYQIISACCYLIMRNRKPQQTFLGFAVCCCWAAIGLPILSTSWGFRERSRFFNVNFGALLPQGTADLVMPFSFFYWPRVHGLWVVYAFRYYIGFYEGPFFKEPALKSISHRRWSQMYSRHTGLRICSKRSRGWGIYATWICAL